MTMGAAHQRVSKILTSVKRVTEVEAGVLLRTSTRPALNLLLLRVSV